MKAVLVEVFHAIDKMCLSCGVDINKYEIFGLCVHIMDSFYRFGYYNGNWEPINQIYIGDTN